MLKDSGNKVDKAANVSTKKLQVLKMFLSSLQGFMIGANVDQKCVKNNETAKGLLNIT